MCRMVGPLTQWVKPPLGQNSRYEANNMSAQVALTRQHFFMTTVTLVFVFNEEMQCLHVVVLSAEVNYAHGMWACRFFGKHLKFSTMRCRKCNFVLIDVKVGLLLTFLASMKAKVRLHQKCVSVFGCLHVNSQPFFEYPFSRSPLRSPDSKVSGLSMRFHRLCVNGRQKR